MHSHINALSVFPLRAAKKAGIPVRIATATLQAERGSLLKMSSKAL